MENIFFRLVPFLILTSSFMLPCYSQDSLNVKKSSLEILITYGKGATTRYAGSFFGDYYGCATQPYYEAGSEIVYRNNQIIAGILAGYYRAEGASQTYYDEVGYTTRIYDPVQAFYTSPFIGADLGLAEFWIGAMYVNTSKPNHLFENGKGWSFPVIRSRIGGKEEGFFFTFSYRSAVPFTGGGGYWNFGVGSAFGVMSVQEIWIGFMKQDRENSALGAKLIVLELFGAKLGGLFTIPVFGMVAPKRTGSTPYGMSLILSRDFSL